jgi:putative endonuclease
LAVTLYILQSASTDRFYIGCSVDLTRRLAEHERGHSPYTRGRGPWKLVYREEFPTLQDARRREQQLKNWKSHRAIAELVAAKLVG